VRPLDGHVAHRHALVHRHALDHLAGVLVRVPDAALDAQLLDDRQNHVLGVDAGREASRHANAPDLERLHRERLAGQHVADLRGADAERHGAERAVRRRVAVAARDGHARLREAELGTDHVHDALVGAAECVERNAVLAAVALERRHHLLGHQVGERALAVRRRHDVVDGREGAARTRHAEAAGAQHVERLRARDLVDEVQADEELRLTRREPPDGVRVPHLLQEGLRHNGILSGKPHMGLPLMIGCAAGEVGMNVESLSARRAGAARP
jgi:hypothetical protein